MLQLKLSIITSVFNSVNFIENCIKNVIEQKCNELEHIIIDAGSTDGTVEVIKKYADKYPHIKWISEPDKGQSDAMNKGIKIAKAEVISFLNADDAYYPFTLNRILDIFNANQKLDFITGNCKVFDLNGKLIYINRPQRIKAYHLFSNTESFPINPAAYFYKKSIHNKIGNYTVNNHYNMDYEFILKASLNYDLVYFNEDWGYMLDHANSKTAVDSVENQVEERKLKVRNQIFKNLGISLKIKIISYRFYKKLI